jgi:hypothetical protein
MAFFFSATTCSFYPGDDLEAYVQGGGLPKDLVEVSDACFEEYALSAPPIGKHRSSGADGLPCWIEKPVEEVSLLEFERCWRNAELRLADIELNKVQDSDPKAFGTIPQWRKYRRELRSWPSSADFPDNKYRPLRPTK